MQENISPEVSVVMPVYNAGKFLKAAIDSILNQTYTDLELIIINDGSKDNSEEIIRGYKDARIKYFYQHNQGVANTLNNGINYAKGKYIWRHDADDISLTTKLEEEYNFLTKHPDIVLCACQVAFMTENGKVAWDFRQPKNKYWQNNEEYKIVTREDFSPYCPITHGTVLVQTDVMKKLGGYRTEFITGEDVDMWLRLIQQYKAAVINKCLSLHRLSGNSATQVHGWKNDFFRNLSFSYFDQRAKGDQDDLEKGVKIVMPEISQNEIKPIDKGKKYRGDLLGFIYPLYINAKDWKNSLEVVKIALKDGWKITSTWKGIVMPIIGSKFTKAVVKFKRLFK